MNDYQRISTPRRDETAVRDDWIPKDAYYSREFAELERDRLWPRVWQVACREEDLPQVGSFHTYEILNDSIIVIRTGEDEIRAYNNACPHRGRSLTEGCGRLQRFVCRFHGWSWNLDGSNHSVTDLIDWDGKLDPADISLEEFRVGRWGGFVFVNMDPDAEPFETFLDAVPEKLDVLEFEKMRYRWFVSVELPANWKTTQEAFAESYHVHATHPQMEVTYDARSTANIYGKHGQLVAWPFEKQNPGSHVGGMRGRPMDAVLEFIRQQAHDVLSIYTDRDYQAASRIRKTLPPDASYGECWMHANEYIREAAIASGAGYPEEFTAQQAFDVGFDWLLFPNTVNVISPTSALWYRSRPTRDNDPDRCIFDMYSLERISPGAEPRIERRHFKDWRDFKDIPPFLIADFENIPEVQKGLKTRGFKGARVNPVTERLISNMHRILHEFVSKG